MNPPKQEKVEPCTSCGKPSASSLAKEPDDTALCSGCANRLRVEEAEERFDPLFRAARILLREGEGQEDRIIPTLALANYSCEEGSYPSESHHLEKLAQDSETWERKAEKFSSTYRGLRWVRVVDGILILERLPLSIHIRYDLDSEYRKQPSEVLIFVYSHRHPPKPDEVASYYEKTLSAADVPYGESRMGSMDFDFDGSTYLLMIAGRKVIHRLVPGTGKFRADLTPFPSPRIVRGFYEMLLGKSSKEEGFYKDLAPARLHPHRLVV